MKPSEFTRKPVLTPLTVHNTHHLNFLSERAKEAERQRQREEQPWLPRADSVPGTGRILRDDEKSVVSSVPSSIVSRPPTSQSILKDGVIMRWEMEPNSMLRRPRTTGVVLRKMSAKMNKKRFGLAVGKQNAEGIVKALTEAATEFNEHKTAAELNYENFIDPSNPNRNNKDLLMKQYHLWNGQDINKMDLPPLPKLSLCPLLSATLQFKTTSLAMPYKQSSSSFLNRSLPPIQSSVTFPTTTRSGHIHSRTVKLGPRRSFNSNSLYSTLCGAGYQADISEMRDANVILS